MSKSRAVVRGLLIILFFVKANIKVSASVRPTVTSAEPVPTITLQAESGATIRFVTQNGRTIDAPQSLDLPHLVLHRDGALTDPRERTLLVEVTNLMAPPSGLSVTLRIETQHVDPDAGGSAERIPVWRTSQFIANTSGITQTGVTASFVREFAASVMSGTEVIATPTDYYRYDLAVVAAGRQPADPWYTSTVDYAFLLENQWTQQLPEVPEASVGAAPDALTVYYCDMFPFRSKKQCLDRQDVPHYVQQELAPEMAKAFQMQSEDWAVGPWYDDWSSFQGEKNLRVALAMPGTWFHGKALDNSAISLLTYSDNALSFQYDSLIDEHMSTFHHELFHNLQLNINRHAGSDNFDAWKFFTEGQAVLASAVGQPDLEFHNKANYVTRANQFLRTGLHKSYTRLDPYQAALYWRFLYEQCGGIDANGVEHPAVGMQIVKRALEEMYAVDRTEGDIVENIGGVMERALRGSTCPFETFEESLVGFAQANYMLYVPDSPCATSPQVACARGYYDPGKLYTAPRLEAELTYDGSRLEYSGAIPASYGMDFIKIELAPSVQGQRLGIRFQSASTLARFEAQVWILGPEIPTSQPRMVPQRQGKAHLYEIPYLDTTTHKSLALIITRLDAEEGGDPTGRYSITLDTRV